MVTIDQIALEVIRNQMSSIAEDMGVVLRMTAFSPNIKERADCSAAVFTPQGEMLAQAEHIPVHLGSMPASVAAIIERFGTEPEPGIQYAVNDPFQGGTHLNDLTLVRPVHGAGRLVAWVGNRAHHADVGGEAPGSMPAHATRLDQEGVVVPPMVAVRDSVWTEEFIEPFLAATRTPTERRGDLAAQLGANEAGAIRLAALIERYGASAHQGLSIALMTYGERRMCAAITALPDGTATFTDHMEWKGDLIQITASVTVAGDELTADLSESADQVMGNINAVRAVTESCLSYAVRVATDPTIPATGGAHRPLRLVTRPGSIVDAAPPAAVAAGNVETSQRISDTILGALATFAPDRVPACGQGTMNNVLIGNDSFAYYETVAGGQGARPKRDGQSGIQTGMTNTKNTPITSLDTHYPFTVTRYKLRRGSGGAGRFVGGDGIERGIRFNEAATVSLMGERRLTAPWGLSGGGDGAVGEDWLIRANGDRTQLPSKCTVEVEPGDELLVFTPGGGGWGTPS
ncbi:MAG: hydantoinase B/oxoprolinase family protein [Actinomycetota bacterium]|nr:hydantoinase B/oxoprolinase family protein [Actinomycetota bacterium]MDK1017594.1 hydantoinase B/oxoprolinase family protein [Actinomycetota bacterium]MDK1026665.1 hydantoinase B/oxoprolinase family protein [Actinomycetota bacterium]MDK1037521.1 hydantoinase B/oxoprolinase family protein [Actinomycetota bacterium]MDK1102339.1 hydantoinase B/oxoprolinase family protein [Actinomycetota bacterium]